MTSPLTEHRVVTAYDSVFDLAQRREDWAFNSELDGMWISVYACRIQSEGASQGVVDELSVRVDLPELDVTYFASTASPILDAHFVGPVSDGSHDGYFPQTAPPLGTVVDDSVPSSVISELSDITGLSWSVLV